MRYKQLVPMSDDGMVSPDQAAAKDKAAAEPRLHSGVRMHENTEQLLKAEAKKAGLTVGQVFDIFLDAWFNRRR